MCSDGHVHRSEFWGHTTQLLTIDASHLQLSSWTVSHGCWFPGIRIIYLSEAIVDRRPLVGGVRILIKVCSNKINPVRAGLLADPDTYLFKSARAPIEGRDNRLVTVSPLLDIISDSKGFIGRWMKQGNMGRHASISE